MITYSHAVVWIWSVAVVATLVGFAVAWRAVARAEAAVRSLRPATEDLAALPAGTEALRAEVASSRAARRALVERAHHGDL